MTPEQAAALRAPVPPEQIGKLPRVSCKDCRNAPQKVCGKHAKQKCAGCGNWITSAHLHLDYFGHAETTNRFLDVDTEWSWEPFALDADGLPLLDRHGGLWIRLTIAGVTRPGYGHADGDTSADGVKVAIGDALRNAGMRFGVALDLWAKSDLTHQPAGLSAGYAKTALLEACKGDKTLATSLWGDRDSITDTELEELLDRAEQELA